MVTQRVTRTGHFETQFGPQVIQLVEGGVKGTDGKIYKSSSIPPSSPRKVSKSTSPIAIPGLESVLMDVTPAEESSPKSQPSRTISPQTTSPKRFSHVESHKKLPSSGSSHKSGMKAASVLLSEVIQAGIAGRGGSQMEGDGHLEVTTADALASQAISEHLQELERVTNADDAAPQE